MPPDRNEMRREDRIRLVHMLEAAVRVDRYCDGLTCDKLADDEMRFAVDWRGIRRMRNRMIHGYDTIDVARVWDAIEIDIPPLSHSNPESGVEGGRNNRVIQRVRTPAGAVQPSSTCQ